jgi:HPt (histidine-containing phosphotransfer) domain-containing protein
MTSTSAKPEPADVPGGTDDALFAALEMAHGERLKETLGRFVACCDAACDTLQDAAACAHWQEAVRLTHQIGDAANELGLEPIVAAARAFADAAYQQTTPHRLRNSAQMVVFEYERFRLALMARYPEFVAPGAYSIA